ncbi:hypothetical protein Mnod_7503 [Methylobacterium nodulans ORS 2060]|uniref:Uncharacterized protein n=1 Tax=Methylobacterium nodulans (strain LMG 21967 / CNCM I-2342 / ORS 2060) TaxID=460265 RepID=B8IPE8_METNO|nr:hypothetical protein Mnod_7503 [Methylobacterium nodulans ORS 2060]
MTRDGCDDAPLRVLTLRFSPGIKGSRKAFRVRAVVAEGRLWCVEQDACDATSWHEAPSVPLREGPQQPSVGLHVHSYLAQ